MARKALPNVLNPLISIVGGLVLWEVVARLLDRPVILIPPSSIGSTFVRLLQQGQLPYHTAVSVMEFTSGFLVASLVGIGLGIVMAAWRPVRQLLEPWVIALYSTPIIAVAPLFIFAFGVGIGSKVMIALLMAFPPILMNSFTGIKMVDPEFVEVGRSFKASTNQIFVKVLIPGAVPFIITGLRIGWSRALVGMVVGEMLGALAGLGFLIINAGQILRMDEMYTAVIILMFFGMLGNQLLNVCEGKLAPWATMRADRE
ncbi:MAG: ABC transporter permease [Deltaproteobacteria bacterium]|nr:ABC transporter permease [Deltaproteobacteria bacterium]